MVLLPGRDDGGETATWDVPAGVDEVVDIGWVAIFDRPIDAAGATGAVTATATADGLGAGALVALKRK